MKVDLIVVTYKPGETFMEMTDRMSNQSVPINKIIVYNVEQKYFERIVYSGKKFLDEHKNMEIHHTSKREADCGKTKNMAIKASDADYVVVMGQNILPTDDYLLEKLIATMESNKNIAVAYARQLTTEDAMEGYKYINRYLYPVDAAVRSESDITNLGFFAYFNSNDCAIYRRELFEELGGFGNHIITGEDVLFAAKAIHAGYKVAYVADAVTVCKDHLSKEELTGYFFDLAVSHAKHPEIFNTREILAMMKKEARLAINYVKKTAYKEAFQTNSLLKKLIKSYKLGLKFKSMGKQKILKNTANPEYWRIDEIMRDRSSIDARLGYGRSKEEVEMLRQSPVKRQEEE